MSVTSVATYLDQEKLMTEILLLDFYSKIKISSAVYLSRSICKLLY